MQGDSITVMFSCLHCSLAIADRPIFFRWQTNLQLSLQIQIVILGHQILTIPTQLRNMATSSGQFFVMCNVLIVCKIQQQYDEKNIRRRVYDALNVLMAMDIISKDKKEIQWKGLPRTSLSDIDKLKVSLSLIMYLSTVLPFFWLFPS